MEINGIYILAFAILRNVLFVMVIISALIIAVIPLAKNRPASVTMKAEC